MMKRTIIMLGVALAWAAGGFADTHEGVQLWENGLPLWQSWVAGLNPLVPDSQLQADIAIVDGEVEVTWTPDLSNAEPKRHYTTMGKTNLTDAAWVIPVNEAHRFFKVTVTMGEPGVARGVTATAGTSAGDVSISWSAVDWAVGYNIYRSTVENFSQSTMVAYTTDTAYVDDAAVPGSIAARGVAATMRSISTPPRRRPTPTKAGRQQDLLLLGEGRRRVLRQRLQRVRGRKPVI